MASPHPAGASGQDNIPDANATTAASAHSQVAANAMARTIANYKREFMPIRPRPNPEAEEDAGERMNLGEWEGVPCLNISEAKLLIDALTTHRESQRRFISDTEITHKTRQHLDRFQRFENEKAAIIENEFKAYEGILNHFERAQLGNLLCDSVEEAHWVVPSLKGKITDDDLQRLLEELKLMKKT